MPGELRLLRSAQDEEIEPRTCHASGVVNTDGHGGNRRLKTGGNSRRMNLEIRKTEKNKGRGKGGRAFGRMNRIVQDGTPKKYQISRMRIQIA